MAIIAEANLEIENSIFNYNTAYYGGGAIIAMQNNVTIDNCSFSFNTAEKERGGVIRFGQVLDLASDLFNDFEYSVILKNSHFSYNSANGASRGQGGVLSLYAAPSFADVNDNVFIGNSATDGGCICLDIASRDFERYKSLMMNVYNNIAINNTADYGGVYYIATPTEYTSAFWLTQEIELCVISVCICVFRIFLFSSCGLRFE